MGTPEDIEEVQAIIEHWAEAVRNKNITSIIEAHSDDVVMYDVPPPLESKGIEAYKRTWEVFFKYSPGGENSFNPTDLNYVVGAKVAFCNGIVKIFDEKVRLTIGLEKRNGKWVITHEHHSYPSKRN